MKVGKLSNQKLQQLVFEHLGKKRPEILVRPGIGIDSAVIDFGDEVCVISADPITGAGKDIGRLAVNVACNDVAAHGAHPLSIIVVLLMPEGTEDAQIKDIMQGLHSASLELGIEIAGGHTEITSKVEEPIVTVTAVGKAKKEKYVSSKDAQPGDDVVITKGVGIEGTFILVSEYANMLNESVDNELLQEGLLFKEKLSIVKEALIAIEFGCHAMHDVTEGGLLGALAEMCIASKLGCDVFSEKIPIHQVTEAVCNQLELNPLALLSSGTLVIASENGKALVEELKKQDIDAAVIGKFTEGEPRIFDAEGSLTKLAPFVEDELWKFLTKQH